MLKCTASQALSTMDDSRALSEMLLLPNPAPPHQIRVIEGKTNRLDRIDTPGCSVGMPRITITSYEMMRRLTCATCCQGSVLGCGEVYSQADV
jgi:hypothetical protein